MMVKRPKGLRKPGGGGGGGGGGGTGKEEDGQGKVVRGGKGNGVVFSDPFAELESRATESMASAPVKPAMSAAPKQSKLLSFEEDEEEVLPVLPKRKERTLQRPELVNNAQNQAKATARPSYLYSTAGEYSADKMDQLRKNAMTLPKSFPSGDTASVSASASSSASVSAEEQDEEDEKPQPQQPQQPQLPKVVIEISEAEDDDYQFIPSAEEIKKARQRREQRRRYDGQVEEGYIPLNSSEPVIIIDKKDGPRLVRDEEDDRVEETFDDYQGSRIHFGDPGKQEGLSEALFNSFVHGAEMMDEDEEEDQRWEMEQIRKGGGASMTTELETPHRSTRRVIADLEAGITDNIQLNKQRKDLDMLMLAEVPPLESLQKELTKRLALMTEQQVRAGAHVDSLTSQVCV
jgi:hypothetical protein